MVQKLYASLQFQSWSVMSLYPVCVCIQDVQLLMDKLTKGQLRGSFYIPKWNHLDFIWGVDAASVVYSQILNILKNQ